VKIRNRWSGEKKSLAACKIAGKWGHLPLLVSGLGLVLVACIRETGESIASESLGEDLHAATKTDDKLKGGLLLNIVIGKGTSTFALLSGRRVQ
jgi:hypothetical protein